MPVRLPAHPKRQTEKSIQNEIRTALAYKGWRVYRIHQSLGSHKGMADLVAMKNGKTAWIEVKAPKGKLSAYQEQFGREIIAAGCWYIVARSFDDVEQHLKWYEGGGEHGKH